VKKLLYALSALLLLMMCTFAILINWPTAQAPTRTQFGPLIVEHVNIIDVETSSVAPDMTVLIVDGVIKDIAPTSQFQNPEGATVHSARGKYMLPGLWDMHSHSIKASPQLHHPLLIANGVTALRDMSGCLDEDDAFWACIGDRQNWEAEARAGTRVSPRYVLQSSFQMNGSNSIPTGAPSFFNIEDDQHAREAVEFYKKDGADFIKVYEELSAAQYDALVAAAAANSLDISGHMPTKISLRHALSAGQTSIEHARLFFMECYADIQAFRELDNPVRTHYRAYRRRFLDEQDSIHCDAMMKEMAASETWWVPTLGTVKMGAYADDPAFRDDPRLKYISMVQQVLMWGPDADNMAAHAIDDDGRHLERGLFKLSLKHIGEAHNHGVKILVGTDVLDTYIFPGFAVHDELSMLVDAGLSPVEALQAATLSPARFSGLEAFGGTVEQGKWADLLILNANPLDNIENTEDIFAVISYGHYYDRSALDELLAFSEEQAGSLRTNIQFIWSLIASPLMRRQMVD